MNNALRNFEGVTCRIPKHFVDLYQASLKRKNAKTNFINQADPLDILDLLSDLSGQLEQPI